MVYDNQIETITDSGCLPVRGDAWNKMRCRAVETLPVATARRSGPGDRKRTLLEVTKHLPFSSYSCSTTQPVSVKEV
jgi:hypothetical protein